MDVYKVSVDLARRNEDKTQGGQRRGTHIRDKGGFVSVHEPRTMLATSAVLHERNICQSVLVLVVRVVHLHKRTECTELSPTEQKLRFPWLVWVAIATCLKEEYGVKRAATTPTMHVRTNITSIVGIALPCGLKVAFQGACQPNERVILVAHLKAPASTAACMHACSQGKHAPSPRS